jgi:DHA2 family multidrug resistance protein
LGTFISTLNGRLSTFGLSDIRGALHAGYDEGAWITTAQTTAQMLVLPVALWLGAVFGVRRMLIQSALAFAAISFAEPLMGSLPALLACQFAGGLATGFFIPLTLSYILRALEPRYWAYGIALYALNLELSLNVSASLEGWYVDHLSWRWIFWQNVPLALGMAACFLLGTKPDAAAPAKIKADWFGMIAGGLGLALIYAALDQGNRLDWLNSGLVCGLLAAGFTLLIGFVAHEWRHPSAVFELRVALVDPRPRLLVLVAFVRLTILATIYLVPQYLITVRGFRAPEVGQTLIWVGAPQLALCALAAVLLRRLDPRPLAAVGFFLIAIGCLAIARGLTAAWSSDQFMAPLLLQALGQSLALTGVIFYGILNLDLKYALTLGGAIQAARLMGGQIGSAFMATLVRVRTQVASNHIGLHVQAGDAGVLQRLNAYAAVAGAGAGPNVAGGRAMVVLDQTVRRAATIQGVIDGFVILAALTAVALVLMVLHSPAPAGPATHRPLFPARAATSPENA